VRRGSQQQGASPQVKASGHGALCRRRRKERSLGQFLVHGAGHRRPRLHRSELQSTLSWHVCWTHLPRCEDKQSLQSEHNEPKTPGMSGYPNGTSVLAGSRTDISRSTPGIRSRCQRHTSHTIQISQTPPASVEVCEVVFHASCRFVARIWDGSMRGPAHPTHSGTVGPATAGASAGRTHRGESLLATSKFHYLVWCSCLRV
jgi:hypothetical protein